VSITSDSFLSLENQTQRKRFLRVRILAGESVVTSDQVCEFARTLPRSGEGLVRGQVKFRIGRIVYLALSRDGTVMGFAFPREWRDALVEAEPEKFSLPSRGDLRYHWVHVRLAAIDEDEMRELVEDAWAFTVPKRIAEEYAASRGTSS
jgi:hypothetical protein